jgi:hypothetical protein
MGNLLLRVSRDLGLYLPVMIGILLKFHEGFRLVLQQEVEDDALQGLVEKLWMCHPGSLGRITIFRPVQVTRELGGHPPE